MKQSLSIKKNEPILWYSQENVDFGSFDESVNKFSDEKIIGCEFKFNLQERPRGINKNYNFTESQHNILVSVDFDKKSLNKLVLKFNGNEICYLKIIKNIILR